MGVFDTRARTFQEKLMRVVSDDMNATLGDLRLILVGWVEEAEVVEAAVLPGAAEYL
jgi:hypothetical protein